MSHKGLAEKDRQIEALNRELQRQKEMVQMIKMENRNKEMQWESARQELRLQMTQMSISHNRCVCLFVCLSTSILFSGGRGFEAQRAIREFSLSPCGPISFLGLSLRSYCLGSTSKYHN